MSDFQYKLANAMELISPNPTETISCESEQFGLLKTLSDLKALDRKSKVDNFIESTSLEIPIKKSIAIADLEDAYKPDKVNKSTLRLKC